MLSISFMKRTAVLALVAGSSLPPLAAMAAALDDTPAAVARGKDVSTTPSPAAAVSGFGMPLGSTQLDDYRGGFTVVKNDMQLNGTVANNSATDVLSGNNTISSGAFSNASGLPMVIQNSGSNVLIQNATILNVQMN